MEIASILAPLISDAVLSKILNSTSAPSAESSNMDRPPVVSILPNPQLTQATVAPTASAVGSVEIPFQHEYYGLTGGETGSTSQLVVEMEPVKNAIQYFQHAELTSLEVIVFPTANAFKIPLSIDIGWSPASTTLGDKVLSRPGGTRIVLAGDAVCNTAVVPCPFTYIGRVIKDNISRTDSPRVNLKFHTHKDHKINSGSYGSVVVRGVVKCSLPTVY